MFTNVLIGLAVLVVVFVAVVAMQPSEFRVARTTAVAAPAARVFAHVNDFHKWEAWSPYDKKDPAMKKTYAGAPAGTGAIAAWTGNHEVGEGSTTIIESRPHELVRIKLEMIKPIAATNTVDFTFRPEGNQTIVTWGMVGQSGFIAKALGLFIDMDKMVGGDFEKGLAQLKTVAEAAQ